MPLALSGLQVDADQAFAKEVVAGAMAAIIIAGGGFNGKIHQAELFVHRDLAPDAGVAGILGRALLPGVVAELAFLGDGVEDPQALAGADVESAHVALVVAHALGRHAFAERGADDDGVLSHDGRGLNADFPGDQVGEHRLIVVKLKIHRAAFAEGRNNGTGLGIERDQAVAGRGVKNARFVFAVGPVSQAAAGKLARGGGSTWAFVLAVDPQQFAGSGVERDGRAARSGGGIHHAIDHQGRAFQLIFGTVADAVVLVSRGRYHRDVLSVPARRYIAIPAISQAARTG